MQSSIAIRLPFTVAMIGLPFPFPQLAMVATAWA
jgi:hypothetical protein